MLIPATHLPIFAGEVGYKVELQPSRGQGRAGLDGGLSVQR
jgi:hypothetical protein